MKNYNQFIKESLRDKMSPISDEDILKSLDKLSTWNRVIQVKNNNLDDKYLPSDEDILEHLKTLNPIKRLQAIKSWELDNKFKPSDEEIRRALNSYQISSRFSLIKSLGLDDKFKPTEDDIKTFMETDKVTLLRTDMMKMCMEYWIDLGIKFNEEMSYQEVKLKIPYMAERIEKGQKFIATYAYINNTQTSFYNELYGHIMLKSGKFSDKLNMLSSVCLEIEDNDLKYHIRTTKL